MPSGCSIRTWWATPTSATASACARRARAGASTTTWWVCCVQVLNSFVKPYKSHEVASACAATARAGASTSTWRTCCAPGFGVGVAGSGQVNGGRVHERVRACAAAGGTMQSRAGQRGSTLWFLKLQGLVGSVGTVAVLPLSAGCAASVSGLCC